MTRFSPRREYNLRVKKLLAFLLLTLALSAQTAPESDAFDAATYVNIYTDLLNAYGTDLQQAREHWKIQGLPKEGRQGSILFDPHYYLENNPDLRTRFGANGYEAALQHFLTTGLPNEGRRGSLEFDPKFYLRNNPDLVRQLGARNYVGAAEQFLNQGLPRDGKQGSPDFDVRAYLAMYPELRAAYGNEGYRDAMLHWLRRGKGLGRKGIGAPEFTAECGSDAALPAGYQRIFIAQRNDNKPGKGTLLNPFDGSTEQRFDTILRTRAESGVANLIVCIAPGTYRTEGEYDFVINQAHKTARGFTVGRGWHIHGSGMDRTTLVLAEFVPNAWNLGPGTGAGAVIATHDDGASNVEVSDLTIDDNFSELKALANRRGVQKLNLLAIVLRSDQGGHRIHRVNVMHSSGEVTEGFPVWIVNVNKGPNSQNNLIEHVTVSAWGGGKCTAIALGNAIAEVRYNTVRDYEIGYGGWIMGAAYFHDNFAIDNEYGFNVDSLHNDGVRIEFNEIIHPTNYGINVGGDDQFMNFHIADNVFRLNRDKVEALRLQGNVTGAAVERNTFLMENPQPDGVKPILVVRGGNRDNRLAGNRIFIAGRGVEVEPGARYSIEDVMRKK